MSRKVFDMFITMVSDCSSVNNRKEYSCSANDPGRCALRGGHTSGRTVKMCIFAVHRRAADAAI
jgi:hypothetical protein